jgi:general secretion pathway protein F
MALFAYIARDSAGRRITGRLEAMNEQSVLTELESRGLAPVRLDVATESPQLGQRVSTRALGRFYRQLGDLLRAGVPMLRAIRLLAGMRSNRQLAAVLGQVADSVEDGERLAESMARFSRTFPEIQISIIRAGERAGFLDEALERLATFMDQRADMQSKVVGNLIYPLVLLVVGAGIVVAALIFFVPRFEEFYADIELPASTQFLMILSNLMVNWWPLLLLLTAGLVSLVFFQRRDPTFLRRWERIRMRLPLIGPLGRAIACARFCRVLGTMLENGIPLIESMQIARGAVGSILLAEALESATEAVSGGDSLATPLDASGIIDPDVIEMIMVGESANNLAEVLVTVADTLESRVDRQLAIAVRLMEPALLLSLAMVVLFIFMALIVPMLRMSSTL